MAQGTPEPTSYAELYALPSVDAWGGDYTAAMRLFAIRHLPEQVLNLDALADEVFDTAETSPHCFLQLQEYSLNKYATQRAENFGVDFN